MDILSSHVYAYDPHPGGLIKIGNIPYSITKDEVVHFLGRKVELVDRSYGCPVHIIMERPTAKTMDCFVEFSTPESCDSFASVIEREQGEGRYPKLGNRHVYVERCTIDALMKEMWPRAKCIVWTDGRPHKSDNVDPFSTGFQGFFTTEEMVGLTRAAETPQRSPFSQKCLQRTYECMISSLWKFPWHAPTLYTVGDRNALFSTYLTQFDILCWKIREDRVVGIDYKLLQDFVTAGMMCPGFSQRQKAQIQLIAQAVGMNQSVCLPAVIWPFDVIAWTRGVDYDYINWQVHRLDVGTQIYMQKEAMPPSFKISRTPYPPHNHIFSFDSMAVTQSMSFDSAVQLELGFAAKILDYVDEYEQGMHLRAPHGFGVVGAGLGTSHMVGRSAETPLGRNSSNREVPSKLSIEIPNTITALPGIPVTKAGSSGNGTRGPAPPSTPPPKTNPSPSKVPTHARSSSLASEPGTTTVSPFGTINNGGIQEAPRRLSASSAAQPITTFSPTIWTPAKDRTPSSSQRGSLSRTTNDQIDDSPTKGKGKSRGSSATELVRADRLPPRFKAINDTIHEEDEEHESSATGGMTLNSKENNWTHTEDQIEREAQLFDTLRI